MKILDRNLKIFMRTTSIIEVLKVPRGNMWKRDINGFEPVSFEELVENNRKWYGRKGT